MKSVAAICFSWLFFNGYQALAFVPTSSSKRGTNPYQSSQKATTPQHQSTTRSFPTLSTNGIWYNDPDLNRANPPLSSSSGDCDHRFIILTREGNKICHLHAIDREGDEHQIKPLFFTGSEMKSILGNEIFNDLSECNEVKFEADSVISMIWLGNHHDEINDDLEGDTNLNSMKYWAIYVESCLDVLNNEKLSNAVQSHLGSTNHFSLESLPLREFGDQIIDYRDAAIHSIANGLIEFHKSHKFCSACGSHTIVQKSGSSRQCSNSKRRGGTCTAPSIYPRIDVASIMLITSPCENYALLGRKASWPSGRYSTLAGFLEIGETMEECCARETLEESGVTVDKNSIKFVRSQPWPFPRSLMVGFQARAKEADETESNTLPVIDFDVNEMEDVKWFSKEFVAQNLEGGSTAINYKPSDKESEFHIPGKASLARYLITSWALDK